MAPFAPPCSAKSNVPGEDGFNVGTLVSLTVETPSSRTLLQRRNRTVTRCPPHSTGLIEKSIAKLSVIPGKSRFAPFVAFAPTYRSDAPAYEITLDDIEKIAI
jgi:hypothetical protein